MDGNNERVRSYFFFASPELGAGQFLASRNPVYVEVFRSDDLESVFPLFKRCVVERPDTSSPKPMACKEFQLTKSRRHRGCRKVDLRRLRSVRTKSYTAAFARASSFLGAATERADAVALRVNILREAIAALASSRRFVDLLTSQGFMTLPAQISMQVSVLRRDEEMFLANLRANALALLNGNEINRRARHVLLRLQQSRLVEAAEFMLLLDDLTDNFALALVAATQPELLVPRKTTHVYGAEAKELKAFVEEGERIFRETKRALCSFKRNSLDLMTLSAFTRRLLANAKILKWLERYEPVALRNMQRTCDR
jgi:hypothetical protein